MNEISTDQKSQDYYENTTFSNDGFNLMLPVIANFLFVHLVIIGGVAYAIWRLV